MEANFVRDVKDAINKLQSSVIKNMNRQMACEAMLLAMIERIDPAALPGLIEEYEAGIDRLAAQVPPKLQMPELWRDLVEAAQERVQRRPIPRRSEPPGAS